jgi:hypothetical protein
MKDSRVACSPLRSHMKIFAVANRSGAIHDGAASNPRDGPTNAPEILSGSAGSEGVRLMLNDSAQ